MTLQQRQIGPLSVSAIGLGCMNLSHAYGVPPSEAEAVTLLNRALDLGVTFLDTAALYGGGSNERLIAKAVMHRRTELVLASKCVLDLVDGKRVLDGSPEAINRTLDAALARLQTDHIDLYYMHRLDRRVPVEESVGALARALEAGKIGAIGLSEMSAATLRRAHAVHPIAAIQNEYSPAVRYPEVALLSTCTELGVGVVSFSPVSRGLLAGSVRDDGYASGDLRWSMPRFVQPNLARNLVIADRFAEIAVDIGITPAQLSLAWVLAQGETVVAIPGTTSIAHLEQNVAAGAIQLSAEILGRIDAVLPPNALSGPRYSAAAQAQIDTELLPDEEVAN